MDIVLSKRYPPKPHWRHHNWFAVTKDEKAWKKKYPKFRHIEGWNCLVSKRNKDWDEDFDHEIISYSNEDIEPLPFNNLIVCTEKIEEYFATNKSVKFGKVQYYHRALVTVKWVRGCETYRSHEEPGLFDDDDTKLYSVTRDCTDSRSTYSDHYTDPDIPSSKSGISLLSQNSWKKRDSKIVHEDEKSEDFFSTSELLEYSSEKDLLSQDLLSQDQNLLPNSITVRIRDIKIKQEQNEDAEDGKPPAKKPRYNF